MSQRGSLLERQSRRSLWCLLASLFAKWISTSQLAQRAASSAQHISVAGAFSHASHWIFMPPHSFLFLSSLLSLPTSLLCLLPPLAQASGHLSRHHTAQPEKSYLPQRQQRQGSWRRERERARKKQGLISGAGSREASSVKTYPLSGEHQNGRKDSNGENRTHYNSDALSKMTATVWPVGGCQDVAVGGLWNSWPGVASLLLWLARNLYLLMLSFHTFIQYAAKGCDSALKNGIYWCCFAALSLAVFGLLTAKYDGRWCTVQLASEEEIIRTATLSKDAFG